MHQKCANFKKFEFLLYKMIYIVLFEGDVPLMMGTSTGVDVQISLEIALLFVVLKHSVHFFKALDYRFVA